ncbi:hypothetical protein U1Q18_050978, partial [Sarracenia purpurea var. burkii]
AVPRAGAAGEPGGRKIRGRYKDAITASPVPSFTASIFLHGAARPEQAKDEVARATTTAAGVAADVAAAARQEKKLYSAFMNGGTYALCVQVHVTQNRYCKACIARTYLAEASRGARAERNEEEEDGNIA